MALAINAGFMTYGLKRVEIFSAQANGLTLSVLAAILIFEGVRRLISGDVPTGLSAIGAASDRRRRLLTRSERCCNRRRRRRSGGWSRRWLCGR